MPCQAWGPCKSDSECQDSANGFAVCGALCLDRAFFPLSEFPSAAAIQGFTSADSCCRRRCYPQTPCGAGQVSGEREGGDDHDIMLSMTKVGCKDNNDCTAGLECQGEGADRKCQDVNECTDPRFKPDAEAFCGPNTNCVNSVGSYSCTCQQGMGLSF